MTKWVVVMVLAIFATGNSFPILFTDQSYRSLEQLDEALANGEITQEYYDEAVAAFAGEFLLYSEIAFDVEDPKRPMFNRKSSLSTRDSYFQYRATVQQELEEPFRSVRYDRVNMQSKGVSFDFSTEHKNGQNLRIRSRGFSVITNDLRWLISVGDFNHEPARGVTFGARAVPAPFREYGSLAQTAAFPIRSAGNGIHVKHSTVEPRLEIDGFISRMKGPSFHNTAVGGDFSIGTRYGTPGLIVMSQRISNSHERTQTYNYLAPTIYLGSWLDFNASGESSFQLGGASAHYYEVDLHRLGRLFGFTLAGFSYAKNYRNVHSNGYAFSDNEEVSIDEIGLEYSDKRPGRKGILFEQEFDWRTEELTAQVVRWQNRLDGRQCVAGRLTFEQFSRFPILNRLRIHAIYQNLDIEHDTDTRKLISVSTKLMTSGTFIYENQHKIEQRVLESSKKYPFRSRHDFTWKITADLESIAMINYYDSDLNSPDDNQLTFAVGQEVDTGRDFRFAGRLQTRYRFATQRLDNWELRVNFEVIL